MTSPAAAASQAPSSHHSHHSNSPVTSLRRRSSTPPVTSLAHVILLLVLSLAVSAVSGKSLSSLYASSEEDLPASAVEEEGQLANSIIRNAAAAYDPMLQTRERRAKESSYVRFGKRSGALSESQLYSDNDLKAEEETIGDVVLPPRQQRASASSYVRFGKRMVGDSYSNCVAMTVTQAKNRADLLNLLVANGCIRRRPPYQPNYVKKDSFVRFG